jgi:hypothetical protein
MYNYLEKRFAEILRGVLTTTSFIVENVRWTEGDLLGLRTSFSSRLAAGGVLAIELKPFHLQFLR